VRALQDLPINTVTRRGLREATELTERIEALLSEELFREVSFLSQFPGSNQVLQKREGYRDIFRAYLQFEMAASLAWTGSEDVFKAGQRNVAALYEYWVFLELGKIISTLCAEPFDLAGLLEVRDGGLQLDVRRGRQKVLKGRAERLGRSLEIELWFNRLFPRSKSTDGSWTEAMRPDYSVKIAPAQGELEYGDAVWVHFDAKYRVDHLFELFGKENEAELPGELESDTEETGGLPGAAKRVDLLKMHSYRDAIRRSAGAYVLYPGSELREMRAFHEILPGLGAFALRPRATGDPEGTDALRTFLEDILMHTASQVSQHERGRFWEQRIYATKPHGKKHVQSVRFLREPPADTEVLIGYVKSKAHLEWIENTRLYNLRADDRPGTIDAKALGAELIVLWGEALGLNVQVWRRGSNPLLMTRDNLFELGYPAPSGHLYHCLRLSEVTPKIVRADLNRKIVIQVLLSMGRNLPLKAPHVTTWQTLVTMTSGKSVSH
jgi:hypothetical protein